MAPDPSLLQVGSLLYLYYKGDGVRNAHLLVLLFQLLLPVCPHATSSTSKTLLVACFIAAGAVRSTMTSPQLSGPFLAAELLLCASMILAAPLVPRPVETGLNPIDVEPPGALFCTQVLSGVWALTLFATLGPLLQIEPLLPHPLKLPPVKSCIMLLFTSLVVGNLQV